MRMDSVQFGPVKQYNNNDKELCVAKTKWKSEVLLTQSKLLDVVHTSHNLHAKGRASWSKPATGKVNSVDSLNKSDLNFEKCLKMAGDIRSMEQKKRKQWTLQGELKKCANNAIGGNCQIFILFLNVVNQQPYSWNAIFF